MQEFEWYGCDWKSLRSNLLKVIIRSMESYRHENGLSGLSSADAGKVTDRLQREVAARVSTDKLGMWEHALPLLVDLESVFEDIEKEFSKSAQHDISWRNRVGSVLKQYLEGSRRAILALDHNVSTNRIKTWERLDQLSRKLAKLRKEDCRCNASHFEALARYVRTHHPKDKNLPKKVSTIEHYFWDFSNECIEMIDNDDAGALSQEEIGDLFGEVGIPELAVSLSNLTSVHRDVISFEYDLEISDVVFMEKRALLDHHQISAESYDKLVLQTLGILQRDLQMQLGG